jgi:predicted nucleotidyltransferase
MTNWQKQVQDTTSALSDTLGSNLVAVWLHGSGLTGKLRPQSDIDLMVVLSGELGENQRDALLATLMDLSALHPAGPDDPRCLEVIGFCRGDLGQTSISARAEFLYGEWLRKGFLTGKRLDPVEKPDNTLMLAQARAKSRALLGPPASELLPHIPRELVRRAMQAAIPELMEGLLGDERNVLLTLARMWHTARSGSFILKDEAAAWAIPQLQDQDAALLDLARCAYLGEVTDDWAGRSEATQRLAMHLSQYVVSPL